MALLLHGIVPRAAMDDTHERRAPLDGVFDDHGAVDVDPHVQDHVFRVLRAAGVCVPGEGRQDPLLQVLVPRPPRSRWWRRTRSCAPDYHAPPARPGPERRRRRREPVARLGRRELLPRGPVVRFCALLERCGQVKGGWSFILKMLG